MIRRLLSLLFLGFLVVPLGAPAQANGPGSVYSHEHYDEPYHYTDTSCGLTNHVVGHTRGYRVIRNVVGSKGQAFLLDDRYRWHETWHNPANGRTATARGYGHFRELSASHVRGDVWRFLSVEDGRPFALKDAAGHLVISDHGRIVRQMLADTLGDHKPGVKLLKVHVVAIKGDYPTSAKGFEFCDVVRKVLG